MKSLPVASLAGALLDPGSQKGIHVGEVVVVGGPGGREEQRRNSGGDRGAGDVSFGLFVEAAMNRFIGTLEQPVFAVGDELHAVPAFEIAEVGHLLAGHNLRDADVVFGLPFLSR